VIEYSVYHNDSVLKILKKLIVANLQKKESSRCDRNQDARLRFRIQDAGCRIQDIKFYC